MMHDLKFGQDVPLDQFDNTNGYDDSASKEDAFESQSMK
jgi:hypothetical protein